MNTVESGLSDDICSLGMCQINQELSRSGRIMYSLVMGIHNRVLDK